MATTILQQHTLGVPFNGTQHNNNLQKTEDAFNDLGPYVISGCLVTAGAGLSVNVSSGVIYVGGHVVTSAMVIGSIPDNAVSWLYILQNGTGTSNLTGVNPPFSVKIGSVKMIGGVVNTINMLQSSGRQQYIIDTLQRPGDQGCGPSIDLGSWAAAGGDGFQVKGFLPGGGLAVPIDAILDNSNVGLVEDVLILRKRVTGLPVGVNGIGARIRFFAENNNNVDSNIAAIEAVQTDVTNTLEKGQMRWHTRNAGVLAERMRLTETGALINGAGGIRVRDAAFGAPTAGVDILGQAAAAGSAPLKFAGGTLLTTPEQGAWEYDNQSPYFTPRTLRRVVPVCGTDSLTANVAVNNTNAETNMKTLAIAAQELALVGRVVRVTLHGDFTLAVAATVTFRFRFAAIGGTIIGNAGVVFPAAVVTGAPFTVRLDFTIRSIGAGGTCQAHIDAMLNRVSRDLTPGGTTTAVDTTVVNDIFCTTQMSVANAGNTVNLRQAFLEYM